MKGLRCAASLLLLFTACAGPRGVSPRPEPSPQMSAPAALEPTPRASASPPAASYWAVKGDFGYGSAEQRQVTAAMCEARKRKPFTAVITTGDNFYQPDGSATPANHDGPERCLNSYPGHRWLPTWGNHDVVGRATKDVLGAPSRYYSFRDEGLELFMLDSNQVGSQEQLKWLTSALAASDARWKVAVFHHPAFTVGGHPPSEEVRRLWIPLFERYGVDLVLSGHNHGYERHSSGGIDHVVTAGGGAPLYPCLRKEVSLVTCQPRYHFLMLEVGLDRLRVEAIGVDGAVFDQLTVT